MTTEDNDKCTDLAKPNWRIAQDFARREIERVFDLPENYLEDKKPVGSFKDHCKREQQFSETVRKWIKDRWLI